MVRSLGPASATAGFSSALLTSREEKTQPWRAQRASSIVCTDPVVLSAFSPRFVREPGVHRPRPIDSQIRETRSMGVKRSACWAPWLIGGWAAASPALLGGVCVDSQCASITPPRWGQRPALTPLRSAARRLQVFMNVIPRHSESLWARTQGRTV